jgi:2-oxo-4-hydroxy-4-carboxy-5-ureidoimidazoline decarboxylase
MPKTLDPRPSTLSEAQLLARFGSVYEHSPWIVATAFSEGLSTIDDAPDAFALKLAAIVDHAGRDRQLALLRAHPELAGRLAVRGELTAESKVEQASARLDQCTPEEFRRFTELNRTYNERFGFPFIVAVRGLTRQTILAAFELRVGNSPEVEFNAALGEVHKIARLRLEAMASRD